MKAVQFKTLWPSCLIAFVVFVVLVLLPVSNTLTRCGSIVTLLAGWSLLTLICWRNRWFRGVMLAIPTLALLLLILPSRSARRPEPLRQEFVARLSGSAPG